MQKIQGPAHHPGGELLLGYAAGSVTGARALIIATHLAFCPKCRAEVADAESIAGLVMDGENGPAVDVAAVPVPDPVAEVQPEGQPVAGLDFAPRHLRAALASPGGRWVNVWFGVKEMAISEFGPTARLLWIPQGRRMPRHDHHGEEMTLVLKGCYSDVTGRYGAGDFQTGTPGLDHQPHAGDDGPCICLVVEEGGLKLSGWLGRLVAWRGVRAGSGMAA